MPQNIRDQEGEGGDSTSVASGTNTAAFERLRNMLLTPPANRPADWVNPLEKIEQLLTCSICLDRYKNPKLLPCQHTFCMEPCLDGLIDLVRRMVRCPECRAEHPLPYDGLKGFQTNYTLVGFLEIHLQATEENATDLESYVKRYNLERCKICDEKAEVDYCPHCEKRICLECKNTHADMIKRDLGRLMNQVKRACSRIVDSSDTLARGVESLNVNCENVKEEIRDYVRRYAKEIKKREEALINEVEAFYNGETRMINTVRDNLGLEAKNMNEACARVEACLKGEKDLNDEELVRYKQMFTEGLDYLRMSNPDADELINKKIRFVITDAHMLSHAILQFGELQVCTPQFNHKFVHAEKMYVPRFLQLGLEADHYPGKKRLDQQSDTTQVPSWKQKTSGDDDAYSSRYRRRQLLEEQAWNRIRTEQEQQQQQTPQQQGTNGTSIPRRSPRSSGLDDTVTGTSPTSRNNTLDVTSPWNRPNRAASDLTSDAVAVIAAAADASSARNRQQQQQRANENEGAVSRVQSRTQDDTMIPIEQQYRDLDRRVANIRKEHERRQLEQDGGTSRASPKRARNRTAPINPNSLTSAGAPSSEQHNSDEEDDENEEPLEKIPVQVFPRPAAGGQLQVDTAGASSSREPGGSSVNGGSSNWRKYLIPSPTDSRHRVRSSTIGAEVISDTVLIGVEAGSSSSRDSDDLDSSSLSADERRRRFIRSRTNPDFSVVSPPPEPRVIRPDYTNGQTGERRSRCRTSSAGSPEGRYSNDEASYHHGRDTEQRKTRYRRKAERSHTNNGTEDGLDPYICVDGRIADAAQRFEISIQGQPNDVHQSGPAGGRYYRVFAQPKIDYLTKGRCLGKFGAKGATDGQLNWPRGIAIIPTTQDIAVCDSSNHRLQIFDKRGHFLKTIGSYGSGRGEFDCLADVCVTKNGNFVVTDRYNHRVQIFDTNGQYLREFGAHGQTNGRFNSPWGVVVDQQGFIYVCDKDNHRVQIFQSDGNYVGKFGSGGNREGQFQNPHFITCDRHNQLIVSDSSNHRIQVFDHNGHYLFSFGSEGYHDGQFKYPRGVAVDEQGFIVVADSGNNRIQVFYPDGRFYVSLGCWGTGDGQLKGVEGVAITHNGRIIVSDRENHRIQVF